METIPLWNMAPAKENRTAPIKNISQSVSIQKAKHRSDKDTNIVTMDSLRNITDKMA